MFSPIEFVGREITLHIPCIALRIRSAHVHYVFKLQSSLYFIVQSHAREGPFFFLLFGRHV